MKKTPAFATEADLCAAFLAWVARTAPDVKAYAEWAGWDILLVYPEGWQLGIQAKLRLNADVLGQAAPSFYWGEGAGPDFRGVLVPAHNALSSVAHMLGLLVFHQRSYSTAFSPDLKPEWRYEAAWFDWNPRQRHELPPTETDAIAGSPAPVSLTPWKLGALAVLAELEMSGKVTTKRVRALGVDPRRWLQWRWLVPAEGADAPARKGGDWIRGEACPPFDKQHPTAYAHALEKARASQLLKEA